MAYPLKIILAQINPTVGDIAGNAERVLEVWKTHDATSDLIVFPELFLSGYPPEDLILNLNFMIDIHKKLDDIVTSSAKFQSSAIVTTPFMIENEGIYNAAVLIEKGEIQHVVFKHHLPEYDVFDEPRVFKSGDFGGPMDFRGHAIGLIICEDLWYDDLPKLYKGKADFLIAVNGSPYDYTKHDTRLQVAKMAVTDSKLPLAYLNMIGGQDELVFDGHSFVIDKNGELVFEAPSFVESFIQIEATKGKIKVISPATTEEKEKLGDIYEALKLGLKDYVHKNGFKEVLLGLSGGVDSALVATLAVDALSAKNVRCFMLASKFTSAQSLEDSKACADNLGVRYEIISIKDSVSAMEKIIPDLANLAHENTQSRLRGTILMGLANMSGALLLTTGNKSEMAVGYCTLYGDMNGAFNPLKDVYKTVVYKLCAWRNAWEETIPARILTKAPSAELRENQTDQDSLPPYDILDAILYCLIEYDGYALDETGDQERVKICKDHPEMVEKVSRFLKNSEFKRFQSAPGTKITRRAFGRDRRYPLTNGFVNKVEIQSL